MIRDLDETLKQVLYSKGGLEPAQVDIHFEAPARNGTAVTRPTVNFLLYDVRENVELREQRWDREKAANGQVRIRRAPLRMNLSYNVSCAAPSVEDQHQLLWRVLETLVRNSPVPQELLRGDLVQQIHPVQTQVAQPDGLLKSPTELWSALASAPSPSINLVVTLDLDPNEETITPLVFTRILKTNVAGASASNPSQDSPMQWELAPLQVGGMVHNRAGEPVQGASVRVLGKQGNGNPLQIGPTIYTDEAGRYVLRGLAPGQYTLVIEMVGSTPQQQPLNLVISAQEGPLPELVHELVMN